MLLGLAVWIACATAPSVNTASADAPDAGPAESRTCDALAEDYGAALAEGQACDPSAPDPCGAERVRRLDDPCHCRVGVSPVRTGKLDSLAAQWMAQSCQSQGLCNRACVSAARTCSAVSDAGFVCGGR
ncbi:MAG: hypothetical protein ACXWLP_12710 [Myxococcaceae bacterium]